METKSTACQRVKIGCVLMASGQGRRFGSNKLLAEFGEKTLVETALILTEGDLFTKRVVLTRTAEVERICTDKQIPVLFHEMPERRQAIRLGVEEMQEMDGILFCPCDQPLLQKESIRKMTEYFSEIWSEKGNEEKFICRLCYGEEMGAPVMFSREFFEELKNLPEHCGGSFLIKKYPEKVHVISAGNAFELMDVDTRENLEYLNRIKQKAEKLK